MEVRAQHNYLRIAPRKVRLVVDVIKGQNVVAAQQHLNYLAKRSAAPISKLLESAAANATNNHGLVKENLYIKSITVDQGPVLKRFRPKGFGMVSRLAKRTSNITVILDERVPGLKRTETKEEKKHKHDKHEEKAEHEPVVATPEVDATSAEPEKAKPVVKEAKRQEAPLAKQSEKSKGIRRFFRRKSM